MLSTFQVVYRPGRSVLQCLNVVLNGYIPFWLGFSNMSTPLGKQLHWKRKLNQKPAELWIHPGFLLNKEIGNFILNFFDLSRPNQLLLLISDVAISKPPTYRLWPQLYRIYRCAIVLWSHINRLFPLVIERATKCHSLVLNRFSRQISQLFPLSR